MADAPDALLGKVFLFTPLNGPLSYGLPRRFRVIEIDPGAGTLTVAENGTPHVIPSDLFEGLVDAGLIVESVYPSLAPA